MFLDDAAPKHTVKIFIGDSEIAISQLSRNVYAFSLQGEYQMHKIPSCIITLFYIRSVLKFTSGVSDDDIWK